MRDFLFSILPITLLLLLGLKIISHLSGVLRCYGLPPEKSVMFWDKRIVFVFQFDEPLFQFTSLGCFAVNIISLDMLLDILISFFITVDSGSIFLVKILLCES